jgi:hypothetical protein
VGGGVQLGPLCTVATNSLLCQPRVIMMMEKLMERLAGETKVLGENLPQCRFDHHKPHMLPGRKPGPCSGKPVCNHLSYRTATQSNFRIICVKIESNCTTECANVCESSGTCSMKEGECKVSSRVRVCSSSSSLMHLIA